MFNELFDLGRRLAQEGKLPPPGFYYYTEPIKWVIHFDPDKPDQSTIRQAEITHLPRPYSGRTSGTQAFPLTDEAAYVLGIDHGKGKGKNTAKKHAEFLKLLDKIATVDSPISHIATGIKDLIKSGDLKSSPKWGNIDSKDWVSIQIEGPGGDGKQLFEHSAIREFWIKELAELCLPEKKEGESKIKPIGECGISGRVDNPLVGRIPLPVKLHKPAPIHSLNADAYVSGMEGSGVFKRCHVGQSIEAGDLIARTLNYLGKQPLHHKLLAKAIEAGKLNTDSPQNLFAFYWIEQPEEAKAVVSINPADILSKASLLFGEGENEEDNAEAKKGKSNAKLPVELSQLEALLNTPWTVQHQALRLDENAFCLLMLSPNKGRISVREWFKVGLGRLKGNLKEFLDAQRIESPDGGSQRSFAIQDMLRALEEANISLPEYKQPKELANPNMTRALLRCAYLGEAPPSGLIEPAVICFRHPKVLRRYEQKNDRERFALLQHQLAAIMKLTLTHPKSEVRMNGDDHISLESRSSAFLSGCLLAVLEEAQLASMNWKINTTLIDQFYSTAATTPSSVLGMLISRVTAQHMPKLRKNMRGKYEKLEILLESIQSKINNLGGFPRTLTLKQQAEFSLGFYTQRAAFRRERPTKTTQQPTGQTITEQGTIS
ncbi:MAG: type I-C CRISPR-associated protein Cas8c/Csd1 [Deltaproteobacteria bacterium]|nr:type I-C CRISPR-associated protein Cas8c/Csd1 [Deltaproteobacteria bacterium]